MVASTALQNLVIRALAVAAVIAIPVGHRARAENLLLPEKYGKFSFLQVGVLGGNVPEELVFEDFRTEGNRLSFRADSQNVVWASPKDETPRTIKAAAPALAQGACRPCATLLRYDSNKQATSHKAAFTDDTKSVGLTPAYAHGTINVALANENGAVVETDSRLSFNGRPVGKGQKLYKLDERTVCAIAGFYTMPLPVFAGSYSPTPSSVPAMIDQYLKEREGKLGESLLEKMNSLVEIFAFDMAFTSSVAISQLRFDPSPSEVTLVGYEGGQLKFLKAHLTPLVNPTNSHITYEVKIDPQVIVGKHLEWAAAGLAVEVTKALGTLQGGSNDFILRDYQASMRDTEGQSMKLQDLRILANEMVRTAARFHPGEVGDERQTAVLTEGKVLLFEQPVERPVPANVQLAGISLDERSTNNMTAFLVVSKPNTFTMPFLYVHAQIDGISTFCTLQPLDNIIFTRSIFTDTCMTYQGSPLTIFDRSNVLIRSTLQIADGTEDSPFVTRFRRDFPNVPIRGGKVNTSAKPIVQQASHQ